MDRDEFIRGYDLLSDALFRHCFLRVGDRELAKDLVGETFLRVWEYSSRGNTIINLKAFLYRILHNLVVDYLRKKKPLSLDALREEGFEPEVNPVPRMIDSFDAKEVERVLSSLPSPYREVIIMRYIDELTPKEISAITAERAWGEARILFEAGSYNEAFLGAQRAHRISQEAKLFIDARLKLDLNLEFNGREEILYNSPAKRDLEDARAREEAVEPDAKSTKEQRAGRGNAEVELESEEKGTIRVELGL